MSQLDHTPGHLPSALEPTTNPNPDAESFSELSLNILVSGPTGAGKSTIINLLTNDSAALPVGDGLELCTTDVSAASIDYEGRKITFFDTAGLDDTEKVSAEHFAALIRRLNELYDLARGKPHIHGVLYIHDINANRMTQAVKTNLRVVQELLGDHMLKNLVFVTNMWTSKPKPRHVRLERELMKNNEYFGAAIQKGARAGFAYRICEDATHEEVQGALLGLFLKSAPRVLQIQNEMAQSNDVEISTVGAGRALRTGLRELTREAQFKLEDRKRWLDATPRSEQENHLREKIRMPQVISQRAEEEDSFLNRTIGLFWKAIPIISLIVGGIACIVGGASTISAGLVLVVMTGLIGTPVGLVLATGGLVLMAGGFWALFYAVRKKSNEGKTSRPTRQATSSMGSGT